MKKLSRALLIGRFQPFHHGHLATAKLALARARRLTILVGSSQERRTKQNPFSFAERKSMIKRGLAPPRSRTPTRSPRRSRITVLPLPDSPGNHPRWVRRVFQLAGNAGIVYTNNPLVRRLLSAAGKKVETPRLKNRRELEGTKIRALLAAGNPAWKKRVPPAVKNYLQKIGAEKIVARCR